MIFIPILTIDSGIITTKMSNIHAVINENDDTFAVEFEKPILNMSTVVINEDVYLALLEMFKSHALERI